MAETLLIGARNTWSFFLNTIDFTSKFEIIILLVKVLNTALSFLVKMTMPYYFNIQYMLSNCRTISSEKEIFVIYGHQWKMKTDSFLVVGKDKSKVTSLSTHRSQAFTHFSNRLYLFSWRIPFQFKQDRRNFFYSFVNN